MENSEKTPLLTALLEGPSGAGKTALAATLGISSAFPFIKIVSAESMVGFSESSKCTEIAKVFEDAHKSALSMIILDDIERLLEYVAIGDASAEMPPSLIVLQSRSKIFKRGAPDFAGSVKEASSRGSSLAGGGNNQPY